MRISVLATTLDKLRRSSHPYEKLCGRLLGMFGEKLVTSSTLRHFLKFRDQVCTALKVGNPLLSLEKIGYEVIKDYTLNFIALRSILEERTTDKNTFDFSKEYKTEVFKLVQSRELQRMVTNSGQLLLFKAGAGNYVYPIITTILDNVKSSDFGDYVSFLNGLFKPFELKEANYGKRIFTSKFWLQILRRFFTISST